VAVAIGKQADWRTAYLLGGGLGLALLVLRIGVMESGMFKGVVMRPVSRGNFFALFSRWSRARRYLSVILVGVPIWYVVGVLITFAPELGRARGMNPAPTGPNAVLAVYAGLVAGDFVSGFLSQVLRTRKKVLAGFLLLTGVFVVAYFTVGSSSLAMFYGVCVGLGLAIGYWAVFVTVASEQFGTNLRATVTTTAPNFVRGSVGPLTLAFESLGRSMGVTGAAVVLGGVTLSLALVALAGLDETFGRDLDFVEE
jgi:hypothetical protein